MHRPEVAIVYRYVPQYRADFYELLRADLQEKGVDLCLYYGRPSQAEAKKGDARTPSWGVPHTPLYIRVGAKQLVWQPVIAETRDADLVIVEQATKLIANYLLWLRSKRTKQRFALWGHGKDFQSAKPSSPGQRLKYWLSTRVDWWFAYNDLSARVVGDLGYPAERITSVQNSIDTMQLIETYEKVTEEELNEIRSRYDIQSRNVAIYSGGMYPEKRLAFLIDACRRIRERIQDFEVIFVGGGIESEVIASFAASNSWVHYVGPVFGKDRIPFFKASKLFLMPGLVGLAVLDCFSLQTPLVTTDINYHSPEIDYLKDGVNGMVVRDASNVDAYVDAVVELMGDQPRRQRLIEEGLASARKLSLQHMVHNFSDGIMNALRAERYVPGKRRARAPRTASLISYS